MQAYYKIPVDDFKKHNRIDFHCVPTYDKLCLTVAHEMINLIKAKAEKGEMTRLILPVGPLDYTLFAFLCNQQGVSCESLVIFSMDQYCDPDGSPVPGNHPLNFRTFFQRNLLDQLDNDKKLPPEQLILPGEVEPEKVLEAMERYGQIDVTYGGFGINGHFAFNSPPQEEIDIETFRNTSVRLVDLREGDTVQMAIGGTGGNLEIIPTKAYTLGLKELLSAELIHLTFMRSWHAGVLRRALFGPVTSLFPGSLVQLHPNVKVTLTNAAAELPSFSLLQNPAN